MYTVRGAYRQFILKVTEDDRDEFKPSNVSVAPTMTLDLVVEMVRGPFS